MKNLPGSIFEALHRARFPILSIAVTYLVSLVAGILMVQMNVPFAVSTRDAIVNAAYSSGNPTTTALVRGDRLRAGLFDFGQNLLIGAVPDTLTGLGIIFPYPFIVYRGWIGGIVSVDENHQSRLAQPGEAAYYLITLILQLIPYSLAGGMGVNLGLAYYRMHSTGQPVAWWRLPKIELADIGRVYLLIVPLFLLASLWEFLMV